MDLAKLIHMLLSQQGGGEDDPYSTMAPPETYSDSVGMSPGWYMSQKNPALHDQLFPQQGGGDLGQPPNHDIASAYEQYKKILLLDQLHRRIMSTKLRSQM